MSVNLGISIGVYDLDPQDLTEVVIGAQTWLLYNCNVGGIAPNEDENTRSVYGALYTHEEAVAIAAATSGYHLPSKTEFETLTGGVTDGGDLKEAGLDHWLTPNTDADNSSGFTALPAGQAYDNIASSFQERAYFWSSTQQTGDSWYFMRLDYDDNLMGTGGVASGDLQYSVRLIKD